MEQLELPQGAAIRPLRREDRLPLKTLLEATQVFTVEEINIALELIDTVLNHPGQHDYVIAVFDHHGPAGYYCIGPTPGTDGTFDLYWIAVDPLRYGQGIGTALDRHAAAYIRSQNGRLIIAETSSTSRYHQTRKFYQTRKYAELARIRDYYRPGDDLVVYGKILVSHQGG
jgi:ribosomal protein S18 acetylase RimI-like enzyme